MKAKDLRKVFKWVLKLQEESGIRIMELVIGTKCLKFKDSEGRCYEFKIDEIVN